MHVLPVEVDVAEVERDRLGRAQPARVDELEERGVAQLERCLAGDCVDGLLDLRERRRLGESASRGAARAPPRAPAPGRARGG